VHTRGGRPQLGDFPYKIFRVPAMGRENLSAWLRALGLSPPGTATGDGHG
jgi:hypothetical protein